MPQRATHITTTPLTGERWEDVVALFGTRGDPSWCWCQYFLHSGKGYDDSAAHSRAQFHAEVTGGERPPGLLAHEGDEPVGWVRVGPRTAYPRLCESKALATVTGEDMGDDRVWAVTCFVVKVGHRRTGVGTALLAAAVDYARTHGARVLEGHPVDVAARASGRASGAELYHGVATTFRGAGFVELGRTGATRPVMRLVL